MATIEQLQAYMLANFTDVYQRIQDLNMTYVDQSENMAANQNLDNAWLLICGKLIMFWRLRDRVVISELTCFPLQGSWWYSCKPASLFWRLGLSARRISRTSCKCSIDVWVMAPKISSQ